MNITARMLIALAAVCPIAFAFSNTLPIVAWSSHSSSVLDLLPSKSTHSVSILENILFSDDVCDHDVVVIIDQPGLHASDLRSLPSSSNLAAFLHAAPSSRQFPYSTHAPASLSSIAESVSARCNSRLVTFTPGQVGITLYSGSKHVVCIHMPLLEGIASSRKTTMAKHESYFSGELDLIASVYAKHLVIFTGSASSLSRRQLGHPSHAFDDIQDDPTLPDGGILKRYQLLTPGLIVTLLVAFFIIVPIVLLGISALASIQSPLRLEPPKGYSAQAKKNL